MRSIDRSRVCHVTDREAMAVIPERRVESVHCCARHNLSRRSPAVPTVQLGSPLDQFVSQSRGYRRRPFSWKRSGAAERGNATFPPPGPLLRRSLPRIDRPRCSRSGGLVRCRSRLSPTLLRSLPHPPRFPPALVSMHALFPVRVFSALGTLGSLTRAFSFPLPFAGCPGPPSMADKEEKSKRKQPECSIDRPLRCLNRTTTSMHVAGLRSRVTLFPVSLSPSPSSTWPSMMSRHCETILGRDHPRLSSISLC